MKRKLLSSVAAIALAGTPFFATGTALAQPSITEEVAGITAKPSPDQPSLSRGEIIERAKTWLTANGGGPVPYSMEKIWGDGYRQDCSGYVSMTWGLDPGGYGGPNTVSLGKDHAFNITKDDLKTGDILIDDVDEAGGDFRHVVLFEKWANDARTSYWGFEQAGTPGHTVYREIPYPYDGNSSKYRPMRGHSVTD
jgi:hypothetical protein